MIFAIMAPVMAWYLKQVSPKLRGAGVEVQQSMGDMTRISEEAIASQRIVKIFGTALFELKKFTEISIRNRKMHTKLAKLSGVNSLVIEVLSAIALSLVVFYSINHFTAGEFAAFVGALLMLISPIKKITAINEQIHVFRLSVLWHAPTAVVECLCQGYQFGSISQNCLWLVFKITLDLYRL